MAEHHFDSHADISSLLVCAFQWKLRPWSKLCLGRRIDFANRPFERDDDFNSAISAVFIAAECLGGVSAEQFGPHQDSEP